MYPDIPFPGFGPQAARVEVALDDSGGYRVSTNARYGGDLYRRDDEVVYEACNYEEAISVVCAVLDSLLTLE